MPGSIKKQKTSIAGRPVTQKDVARAAGVSPSIVSFVINNGPRTVSEETRQRVLQAIDTLGYRPNIHAQQLMRQNWGTGPAEHQIGVIFCGSAILLQRLFYSSLLSGVFTEAHRQNRRVRFVEFSEDLEDLELFHQLVDPDEVSGVILISGGIPLEQPKGQQLVERTIGRIQNIVTIGRKIGNLPSVMFDLVEAADRAVTHLIHLGHTHIGFIGNSDRRLTGYRRALFENSIPILSHLITHPGTGMHTAEEGYLGIRKLLEVTPHPTAVFAGSDEVAMGVLRGLQERGLRVPEDVALVGINDLDYAAFLRPPLTTVRLPSDAMGIYAIRLLVELTMRPEEPPVSMMLPTELIIRDSCGYRMIHPEVTKHSASA